MTKVSANRLLAVTPFSTNVVEKQTKNGFSVIKQKITLTPLRVVYNYPDLKLIPGDIVWVRADLYGQAWAKQIFEIDNTEFILMPIENALVFGINCYNMTVDNSTITLLPINNNGC